MLSIFKNSGMLLLIMVSFFVTHMEPMDSSSVRVEKERMIPSATTRGEILYVANTPEATQPYGPFTDQIEQILSVTPDDSEIYIEEREGGKWYLKIEKLFSREQGSAESVVPTPPEQMMPPTSMDEPQFTPLSSSEDNLLV